MLSSEFTSVLTKPVTIPQSGFVNTTVYILALNSNPDDSRVVEFFLAVGSFQSAHKTIGVAAEGSKVTIVPVELPHGEYTLTVYAKADKDECVELASVSASSR